MVTCVVGRNRLPLRQFDGFLTASYAILHSVGRFAVERFRHDNRGNLGARTGAR